MGRKKPFGWHFVMDSTVKNIGAGKRSNTSVHENLKAFEAGQQRPRQKTKSKAFDP